MAALHHLIAGRAYAATAAESIWQHAIPKASFPHFVIAQFQEIVFTSDNTYSRK
jgi:hypothetical protein